LLDLLRSGLLDISPIRPRVYLLLRRGTPMGAAATAGNLECIVVHRSDHYGSPDARREGKTS
jgi:alcohol dehydrogenase